MAIAWVSSDALAASQAKHPFSYFALFWFPSLLSPLHVPTRARWSSSRTSQLLRLRSSEETELAQGHITSQTRTPVPTFPAPHPTPHTPGCLRPLQRTRQSRTSPGLWRLPRASLICGGWGRVCQGVKGPLQRSSCHLFSKTSLIWPAPPL